MPFRSQNQWRWAFANKKPFADKWARETNTPFRSLPTQKASTGGDFSAGAGEQITGNRCRDANGHFAPCDQVQGQTKLSDITGSMAAWQTAQEENKFIANEEKKLRRRALQERLGYRTSSGSGKISAAERKRQQRAEQMKNEADTHAKVGPGADLGAALSQFADPSNPGMLNNLTANKLAEYGLVQAGKMGNWYITGEGRAYLSAARSGDIFAAREAFQRAREAYQAQLEAEQKRQEQEQFDALIQQYEGTPQERRLRLAQERYDKLMNPKQPKAPKAPKQPNPEKVYGSGKVIAGSPKSTVKSITNVDNNEGEGMNYYPPKEVLKEMIVGRNMAIKFRLDHPNQYYAEKAINNIPLTIDDIKKMQQMKNVTQSLKGVDDKMTPRWVAYQLLGAAAGQYWIDSVMDSFYFATSLKEVSSEDRQPSLSASVEAIRGLDLQHHFQRGGSPDMIRLGRKIANRDTLSDEEIRAMHKYLIDNEDSEHDGDPVDPSVSHINWQIHGGDEGLKWSRDAVARLINDTYKEGKVDMIPSQSLASTAMRGLDLHHYFKRGGSSDMLEIARKLANKKEMDPEDVRKMHTYLKTHENDKRDGNPSNPSVSYINWMLHGGNDGIKWVNDRIERLRMSRTKIKEQRDINFSPPQGARSAAKRGLELRDKFNRGGTAVGVARARDLSNGKNMSPSTIRRMNSFFARHAVDKRPNWSDPSKPSNGYIAHLLWGGDSGRAWAGKVSRQLDAREKSYTLKHERGRHSQLDHGRWAEGLGGARDGNVRGGGGRFESNSQGTFGGGGGGGELVLGNVNSRRSREIQRKRMEDNIRASNRRRDTSRQRRANIISPAERARIVAERPLLTMEQVDARNTRNRLSQLGIDSSIVSPAEREYITSRRPLLTDSQFEEMLRRYDPRNDDGEDGDLLGGAVPVPRPPSRGPQGDRLSAMEMVPDDELVLANRGGSRDIQRDGIISPAERARIVAERPLLTFEEMLRRFDDGEDGDLFGGAVPVPRPPSRGPRGDRLSAMEMLPDEELVLANRGRLRDIQRKRMQDNIRSSNRRRNLSGQQRENVARPAMSKADILMNSYRNNIENGMSPEDAYYQAIVDSGDVPPQRAKPQPRKISRYTADRRDRNDDADSSASLVPNRPIGPRPGGSSAMAVVPKEELVLANRKSVKKSLKSSLPLEEWFQNAIVNGVDSSPIETLKSSSRNARRNEHYSDWSEKSYKSRTNLISQRRNAVSTSFKGKNKPTNPSLWSKAISEAKKRFRVYPSAYANGWAAKWYKKHGGDWRIEKS